jgi:sialate O-acetylesterase
MAIWALASAALWSGPAHSQETGLRLNGLLADHAVVQRGKPILASGTAPPGSSVTVTFAGRTAETVADGQGAWTASLPGMPAGGPYDLAAKNAAGAERRASDVMVGDVFLCSGQSNMEFELRNAASGAGAVASAADPGLRLLTVEHAASPAPHPDLDLPAAWRVSSPTEAAGFSAVCDHFGRQLRRRTGVPIGLVQSTWSGSYIESWIGPGALERLGGYDGALALNALYGRDPLQAQAEVGRQWEAWWKAAFPKGSEPWRGDASLGWKPVPLPWRNWTRWGVPGLESNIALVWFKRDLELTVEQASQASRLRLAELHEQTEVWINGQPVAASFNWGTEGEFALPKGVLRPGVNTIVAGVYSGYDPGGLLGPAERMSLSLADGSALPLGYGWRYAHPASPSDRPPMAPWFFYGGTAILYDAMIQPLAALKPRGVLWYQGESNTGHADRYQGQLAALEQSWRELFGEKTPFLIVQLPNFGSPNAAPAESDWASLREAQRRAVAADPASALVVTIDLGLDNDLHPPNKEPVGARAARAAAKLVYGDGQTPSGPRPVRAVGEGAGLTVEFADIGKGLVTYSSATPTAFEVCGPAKGSCRFVSARLDRGKVRLGASAKTATRVRYCWGDAPRCNLYDGSGLPVGPFEIAVGVHRRDGRPGAPPPARRGPAPAGKRAPTPK